MAATLAHRAWRDSSPQAVEVDLAALWREVAARGSVTRAVMSNLVVFRLRERRTGDRAIDRTDADLTLDAVVALHPSRTIVIEHERGARAAVAPSDARVAVAVFGPPHGQYGVERIYVTAACADVSWPSVVSRFIRGDRPTSLWWLDDLSQVAPAPALVHTARQFVYDSRSWRDVQAGFRAIAPFTGDDRVDIADLNWRRLDPLRRGLVNAGTMVPCTPQDLEVVIEHRPGEAALASLLAAWIAARVKLPAWPTVQEKTDFDETLSVTIDTPGANLTASLNRQRAVAKLQGAPPIVVPVPRTTAAETVAAELRSLSCDTALAAALAALAARIVR